MSDEGFAFLDASLAAIGPQPAVIATHHPWMHTGIRAMDGSNLRNGADVLKRLESHPAPVRMISGHVHRVVTGQIGRVTCQIAPALCHAVLTDHRDGRAPQLLLEPGAVSVFQWIAGPSPCLVSDVLPMGSYPGPWPFDG